MDENVLNVVTDRMLAGAKGEYVHPREYTRLVEPHREAMKRGEDAEKHLAAMDEIRVRLARPFDGGDGIG